MRPVYAEQGGGQLPHKDLSRNEEIKQKYLMI